MLAFDKDNVHKDREYTIFKKFWVFYVPVMKVSEKYKKAALIDRHYEEYMPVLYSRFAWTKQEAYALINEAVYDWRSFFGKGRTTFFFMAAARNAITYTYYNTAEDFKNTYAEEFV